MLSKKPLYNTKEFSKHFDQRNYSEYLKNCLFVFKRVKITMNQKYFVALPSNTKNQLKNEIRLITW